MLVNAINHKGHLALLVTFLIPNPIAVTFSRVQYARANARHKKDVMC